MLPKYPTPQGKHTPLKGGIEFINIDERVAKARKRQKEIEDFIEDPPDFEHQGGLIF